MTTRRTTRTRKAVTTAPPHVPLEERLEAIRAEPGAKNRLDMAHALLGDVEQFKAEVSAERALAALTLVEDGDKDGRIYSQLEISRLLGKSASLGQQLVLLGRQIREQGGPVRKPYPSKKERAKRLEARLNEIARRMLEAEGKLPTEEAS